VYERFRDLALWFLPHLQKTGGENIKCKVSLPFMSKDMVSTCARQESIGKHRR